MKRFTVVGIYWDNKQVWIGYAKVRKSQAHDPDAVLRAAARQVCKGNGWDLKAFRKTFRSKKDDKWEQAPYIRFIAIFKDRLVTEWSDDHYED